MPNQDTRGQEEQLEVKIAALLALLSDLPTFYELLSSDRNKLDLVQVLGKF